MHSDHYSPSFSIYQWLPCKSCFVILSLEGIFSQVRGQSTSYWAVYKPEFQMFTIQTLGVGLICPLGLDQSGYPWASVGWGVWMGQQGQWVMMPGLCGRRRALGGGPLRPFREPNNERLECCCLRFQGHGGHRQVEHCLQHLCPAAPTFRMHALPLLQDHCPEPGVGPS